MKIKLGSKVRQQCYNIHTHVHIEMIPLFSLLIRIKPLIHLDFNTLWLLMNTDCTYTYIAI